MSLKTKVKVGNITNLSDARYCAGMGVDMLGFTISEVDGQGIGTTKFKEITDWISGPEFVLEIKDDPTNLSIEKYRTDLLELPASRISFLSSSKQEKFIISIDIADWPTYREDLLVNRSQINYLLLTNPADIEISHVKRMVEEIALDFPILLGVNIKFDLLGEYLSWPILGIALNGSEETSPGIKDYEHLSSILEKLEVD